MTGAVGPAAVGEGLMGSNQHRSRAGAGAATSFSGEVPEEAVEDAPGSGRSASPSGRGVGDRPGNPAVGVRDVGLIGGGLGYRVLRRLSPGGEGVGMDGSAYTGRSKLAALLGEGIRQEITGETVIDFGCGEGGEAIEMAEGGASRVIGLDIREPLLDRARTEARERGSAHRCDFVTSTSERVDVIAAMDSFEHFDDPAAVLAQMRDLLKPDSCVLAAFGPTWYRPLGGHLSSVFPWAHLVLTEKALIRWRSDFKRDRVPRSRGSRCFGHYDAGGRRVPAVASAPPPFRPPSPTDPLAGLVHVAPEPSAAPRSPAPPGHTAPPRPGAGLTPHWPLRTHHTRPSRCPPASSRCRGLRIDQTGGGHRSD